MGLNKTDRVELEAYRALGTVEELTALRRGVYPDDEDRAPLPPLCYQEPELHLGAGLLDEEA